MPAPTIDGGVDHVVVLAGGDPIAAEDVTDLARPALVIAADSGIVVADVLGLAVDLLVGDLDSVPAEALAAANAAGVPVDEHPTQKDQTDLAIALDVGLTYGPELITVVGGHGGRLDHLLANALLLASPAYATTRMIGRFGPATVTVVRDATTVTGRPGELISLLAVHGPATGVTTHGLRFPLVQESLSAGSSRGVSNVFVTDHAQIELTSGVLLAVQPGEPA